jgi:hypothetical protein
MQQDDPDAGGALASAGSIEHGMKADPIDGVNWLGNEGLVCGLTEFKFLFEFLPDIPGSFNLGGCAGGRHEGACVTRSHPWDYICAGWSPRGERSQDLAEETVRHAHQEMGETLL